MSRKTGRDYILSFGISQVDLLASTVKSLVAPVDGYISELSIAVTVAVTTGGTLKVQSTNAATNAQYATTPGTLVDVAGCSVTIANGAVKNTGRHARPTDDSPTQQVKKGDIITIVPASFATAGAVEGSIVINTGSPYKA